MRTGQEVTNITTKILKKNNMKLIIVALIFLAAISAVALSGCVKEPPPPVKTPRAPDKGDKVKY